LVWDVLANTPYHWFIASNSKGGKKLLKLIKIPKMLRAIKLLRTLKDQQAYCGPAITFCFLLYFGHLYACAVVYAFLGDCDEGHVSVCPDVFPTYLEGILLCMSGLTGSDSWARLGDGAGGSTSLLTASRSEGQRLSPAESLVFSSMIVVGIMLIASMFANVALTLQTINDLGVRRCRLLAARKNEMKVAQIPDYLANKVVATYDYVWLYGGQHQDMLQDPILSMDLKRELALSVHGEALRKVPIFLHVPDSKLKCLAQRVESRLYCPTDLLFSKGETGNEIFIIQSGSVMLVDEKTGEGIGAHIFSAGDFFGELCFLHPGSRRNASIMCKEFCRSLVLTLSVFEELGMETTLDEIRIHAISILSKTRRHSEWRDVGRSASAKIGSDDEDR
jgi:hypothetical protein